MSAFLKSITEGCEIKTAFDSKEECYEQGQAAYSQAYRRDQNPYPVGTSLREWWDGGFLSEQDELCGT